MRHKNSTTACRRHAEACKRLARRSRDEALTSMLLMMARSWVALANQIDRYTILRKQLKRTARWAAGQHQSLAAHRSGPSLGTSRNRRRRLEGKGPSPPSASNRSRSWSPCLSAFQLASGRLQTGTQLRARAAGYRRQGREHCCSLAGSHNPDLSTPAHS